MAKKIDPKKLPFFVTKEPIVYGNTQYFIPMENNPLILIELADNAKNKIFINELIQLNPIPAFIAVKKGVVTMQYHS